jgi:hypothetical protein
MGKCGILAQSKRFLTVRKGPREVLYEQLRSTSPTTKINNFFQFSKREFHILILWREMRPKKFFAMVV